MVKLLLQKMLRDMKKSMAAYGICLLIVAVGFCGYCLMSVAEDHLIASRDLLGAPLPTDSRKCRKRLLRLRTS